MTLRRLPVREEIHARLRRLFPLLGRLPKRAIVNGFLEKADSVLDEEPQRPAELSAFHCDDVGTEDRAGA